MCGFAEVDSAAMHGVLLDEQTLLYLLGMGYDLGSMLCLSFLLTTRIQGLHFIICIDSSFQFFQFKHDTISERFFSVLQIRGVIRLNMTRKPNISRKIAQWICSKLSRYIVFRAIIVCLCLQSKY